MLVKPGAAPRWRRRHGLLRAASARVEQLAVQMCVHESVPCGSRGSPRLPVSDSNMPHTRERESLAGRRSVASSLYTKLCT
ncbi:hypothetical protein NDU88_000977 [Pleurodeles waltl]|uniref:Uncharacterized protein n=1 Tax=Pleurodeles waltl TaxID=8319 RepID=A0AAV7SB19_PLEWA|nr:hypothetical protein NDU88_000977 [Pleurodeles waltl]